MDKSLKITRVLGFAPLAIGISHAAVVSWDGGGGDNSWQTATNWDNDLVPVAADDITIGSGAAVEYNPGGDLIVDGGSLTITGGSSWSQTPTNWTQIKNGTMTLVDSTFTRGGGNLVVAPTIGDNGAISLTNSTISLGGELWFGSDVFSSNEIAEVSLTSSTIDANGAVGVWFWDSDASGTSFALNFLGAGSTVNGRVGRRSSVGGQDASVTWETMWDEGLLQYNGSSSGTFTDFFITSGTPGTTSYSLQSIPEPATSGLFGLAGLALLIRRKRG